MLLKIQLLKKIWKKAVAKLRMKLKGKIKEKQIGEIEFDWGKNMLCLQRKYVV